MIDITKYEWEPVLWAQLKIYTQAFTRDVVGTYWEQIVWVDRESQVPIAYVDWDEFSPRYFIRREIG